FAIVADLGSRGLQAVEHASQHIAGILLIEPELDAAREDARESLTDEPRERVANLAVAPRLDRHRREDVETRIAILRQEVVAQPRGRRRAELRVAHGAMR